MDSGLEERIVPSIRRSQILLIYRNGVVVNPETCGQIACSVGRLPIRFTVGTGGTITVGTDGDLRSDRVRGRETTHPFHGGYRRHDHKWVQTGHRIEQPWSDRTGCP